jgi:hypothetical protein
MSGHAIQRAMERYGLALTEADLLTLQAQIRLGRSVLLKRDGDGNGLRLAKVGGVTVLVVARPDGWVLTFLPPRARQICRTVRTKGKHLRRGRS